MAHFLKKVSVLWLDNATLGQPDRWIQYTPERWLIPIVDEPELVCFCCLC